MSLNFHTPHVPLPLEYIALLPDTQLANFRHSTICAHILIQSVSTGATLYHLVLYQHTAVCPLSVATLRDNIWSQVCVQSHKY